MRLPPTVSLDRCVSFLLGLISQTNRPYVTIFPLGTKCLGMNARVLVPVGIRVPMPLASRPSSFAKDVCHVVAVGPLTNLLYSSDAPVDGSRTELIALVRCCGILCIASMLAAVEYLDVACDWVDDGRRRLTRAVC